MSITAASLMVRVGADTSGAEAGLQSFDTRLKNVAKTTGAAGLAISAGVTAPVMGIATMALRSAGDFEQSMAMMQVASSATASEMAALQEQAIQLGADTVFSAGEAAQGMLELAKAGLSAEQIGGAIAGVMDLAAAGGLGLAQAAEIAANAMNAFGLEAADMGMLADLMAAAANASSIEVTDLAMSYQMASAVFAASGQSIQDLTTALAILGNYGLKGSDAGTSLKQMMLSLTAPTQKAKDAMAELGISVYDAQGAILPFESILASLGSATEGLTDKQRNAALAVIFGSDAVRAANILIDAGTEGWNAMSAAVQKQGAASEMAGARMSGLKGAFEQLSGAIDSLLIGEGIPFLDMISGWIRGLADLVSSFANVNPAIQAAVLSFLGIVAVAGPVLMGIAGIAAGIAALANPIGATIAIVATLGAAFAADFMGIRTAVTETIEFLRPGFEQLMSWISSASQGDWGPLKEGLQGTLKSIQATIENFTWADFVEAIRWADFVTTMQDWGAYIVALPWADYVTAITDWGTWIGQLLWDSYLTALQWELHVGQLAWDAYIAKLQDWGQWLTTLDWTAIVTTLADWSTWIVLLPWNSFVKGIDLATYVVALVWENFVPAMQDWNAHISDLTWDQYVTDLGAWTEYITAVDWDSYITAITSWSAWITSLNWGDYITAIVDWSLWIGRIVWSEFIDNLTWPAALQEFNWTDFVGDLSWAADVATFDWGDFVSSLEWPEGVLSFSWDTFIDHLNWPWATKTFSWSTFVPQVQWPWDAIRNFDWGRFIPSFSWPGFGKPEINASGTALFGGGLTWVGERGPELVSLPGASRIYNNRDSREMAGGGDIIINATVTNEIDIERLAWQVRQELRRL